MKNTPTSSSRLSKTFLIILLHFSVIGSLYSQSNSSFINYSTKDGMSHNFITSIFMDSRGYLWTGTYMGLNRFNGTKFKKFTKNGSNSSIDNDYVRKVTEDQDGKLWILTDSKVNRFDNIKNEFNYYSIDALSLMADHKGRIWATTKNGLMLYDASSNQFKLKQTAFKNCTLEEKDDKGNLYLLFKNVLLIYNVYTQKSGTYIVPVIQKLVGKRNSLYVDKKQNVWVATPTNGLYLLEGKTHQFSSINNTKLNQLITGECGGISGKGEKLYFATAFNGLIIYDTRSNTVTEVSTKSYPKSNIEQDNINQVYVDRNGGVWLGTTDYGIEYLSPYANNFEFYSGNKTIEKFKTIGRFEELGDEILIGSGSGLLKKNKFSNQIESVNFSGNSDFKTGKFIKKDNNNLFWIAYYNKGVHLCDYKAKKVLFSIFDDNYYFVKDIIKDNKNRTWILSRTSFGQIVPNEKKIVSNNAIEKVKSKAKLSFNSMVLANDQCIYIGTRDKGLLKYNPEKDSYIHYNQNNCKWIQHNSVSALLVDNRKNLWIGTHGGGIGRYNTANGSYKNFSIDNGLINNCITAITEDRQHTIWCSSLGGLSSIDVKDNIRNFTGQNGYQINQAEALSIRCLSNNQVLVGGNNGFTIFSPNELKRNPTQPQLEFSRITIQGEPQEEEKINEAIRDIKNQEYTITVDYNSFPIEIEYSTIAFTYPQMNQYAYKLSGVNKEWVDLGNKRSFLISDLKSGNHTFSIKACNNDGVWNEKGISLKIHVNPPFWFSWWAYLFYILAIAMGIRTYQRYYESNVELKNSLKNKQLEKLNMEQFYEKKMLLFTNLSHELRTPLTLIAGPVEQLLKDPGHNQKQFHLLNLIKSNSDRLLTFVNQLMDLRKMESGNYQLKKGNYDFIDFAQNIVNSFANMAETKSIALSLNTKSDKILLHFDKLLFESVLFNLLSNAFKFTPQNGKIGLEVNVVTYASISESTKAKLNLKRPVEEQYIMIKVSDNGKGIKEEHIDQVFDQFYQIENAESNLTDIKGTGVGLHLANHIVHLHDGVIFAENNVPQGTTFTIYIPNIQAEIGTEALETEDNLEINTSPQSLEASETADRVAHSPKSSFTILVVEDNQEIRQYITLHLNGLYKILEAENGEEALEIIRSKEISLVISDIMMPVMDGLELCKRIKTDLTISDIPVILLTARAADEQVIEGYEMNADDYISKPFNIDILTARVKNILQKHILIRQKFSTHISIENTATTTLTLDEKFIQKVYALINQNIETSEFELEDICNEIGISKMHLNRKIKALTGLTPSKLILKFRLNKAEQLIARGERSITELAYACGFNDANNFTRCFKLEFKVTPTEYLKMKS